MNQFNKEILDALSSDSKTSLKDVFRNQRTIPLRVDDTLKAIMPSKYTDEIENSSYIWRAFKIG